MARVRPRWVLDGSMILIGVLLLVLFGVGMVTEPRDSLAQFPTTPATPRACDVAVIAENNTPATVISGPSNGYYITNPASSTDQGIATAENLYVNVVTTATVAGYGTNSSLLPGQTFNGFQSKVSVSVVASSANHRFTCVRW